MSARRATSKRRDSVAMPSIPERSQPAMNSQAATALRRLQTADLRFLRFFAATSPIPPPHDSVSTPCVPSARNLRLRIFHFSSVSFAPLRCCSGPAPFPDFSACSFFCQMLPFGCGFATLRSLRSFAANPPLPRRPHDFVYSPPWLRLRCPCAFCTFSPLVLRFPRTMILPLPRPFRVFSAPTRCGRRSNA
jgi:hypothetical protein